MKQFALSLPLVSIWFKRRIGWDGYKPNAKLVILIQHEVLRHVAAGNQSNYTLEMWQNSQTVFVIDKQNNCSTFLFLFCGMWKFDVVQFCP